MPFGNVVIAICYDSRRKHFYDKIKEYDSSLILFPRGSLADSLNSKKEQSINDYFCNAYLKAFGVPVVYVNSVGKLDFMLGKTGRMMAKANFNLNGLSRYFIIIGSC